MVNTIKHIRNVIPSRSKTSIKIIREKIEVFDYEKVRGLTKRTSFVIKTT